MLTLVAAVLTYDFARERVEPDSARAALRSLSLKVRSETRVEKDMVEVAVVCRIEEDDRTR